MINERYLFRGKIKYSPRSGHLNRKNGQWVQGHYKEKVFADGMTPCIAGTPVDDETIGQCTGLRDKNGMLIFEGDIVQYADISANKVFIVIFAGGGFCLCDPSGEMTHKISIDSYHVHSLVVLYKHCMWEENCAFNLEIICNIHDNPELLEGGEFN